MSSLTEQVGRVVGGRYRLLAPVGAGASARVFAADDTRLGRIVAVKLLHPALIGDATFLRRFQAEARLAASLNHRNVLHVYDWGDDDGVPYLVLEYLGGGSLRTMLDDGARLSPGQAAAAGAQAAHGLAYAHRRGLVHRDIKPANLLFDDDGRLLVADFGLARALAEAAVTEPLGGVLGTARYASPEQVEGRAVDDRTDVYSLALVLYEAVTGHVPFVGDTTVATLMARVGATLPPARELGPLAPVLAQAAISEPLARLDAAGLATELDLLVAEIGPGDPLPLAHIDLSLPAAGARDRDPTDPVGAALAAAAVAEGSAEQPWPVKGSPFEQPEGAAPVAEPPTRTWPAAAAAAAAGAGAMTAGGPAPSPQAPPAAPSPPVARPDPARVVPPPGAELVRPTGAVPGVRRIEPPPPSVHVAAAAAEAPKRRHRLRWALVVLVAVLLVAAGGAAFVRFSVYGHVVPKVAGLTVAEASGVTHHAGLLLVVAQSKSSLTVPSGVVISQRPGPGAHERQGAKVIVVESSGLPIVTVPDVTGLSQAEAGAKLKAAFLNASFVEAYSATVATGRVVSISPNTPTARFGTKIVVQVSKGPPPVTIPSGLVGQSISSVLATLRSLGLRADTTEQSSTAYAAGDVIETTPLGGKSVAKGSTVTVVESTGPPYVLVPSLYGDSVSSAEAKLSDEGLKYQVFGPSFAAVVYTTDPLSGNRVQVGSVITIYTI